MAETQNEHGQMDVRAQQDTWQTFTWLLKWGTISAFILGALATLMVFLVNN